MPKLIKMYITQVLIGFAIAAAFVGALLFFNVANLWHLVTHTQGGVVAVAILWFANGIVFSGVQFAIRIMGMAESDGGSGGKRDDLRSDAISQLEPIPVKVTEHH